MNRILVALVLLAVLGFCLFGFMATFEPPGFMGWRIGYAIVGVLCMAGIARALLAKPRGA